MDEKVNHEDRLLLSQQKTLRQSWKKCKSRGHKERHFPRAVDLSTILTGHASDCVCDDSHTVAESYLHLHFTVAEVCDTWGTKHRASEERGPVNASGPLVP